MGSGLPYIIDSTSLGEEGWRSYKSPYKLCVAPSFDGLSTDIFGMSLGLQKTIVGLSTIMEYLGMCHFLVDGSGRKVTILVVKAT